MTEDVFIFPMSFSQQRLWFLDQLEPNSASYNIPAALRLTGRLNVEALKQSLNEIVARHEVLRTTFATMDGEPVQVVAPMQEVDLSVVNLAPLPAEERETTVQRLADEEAQRPFDLRHGPLLRVTLLRLSDESHVLLVTMHHIISDGWSMGIFTNEVVTLYDAFAQNKPSPLPELPIQYADFAVWQREWLSGETLERQLSYWREQLIGAPPLLELPTDRPRPPVQTFRGDNEFFELSASLSQPLKTLSQQAGATLFMTLLAAWGVLLWRYSAQHAESVVIGSPIANRNRKEIEPLIGFFVNTLLFHLDFSGNPTFLELLAQVRQKALDAYAHQDLPFEKLVDELQPERNLSHSPLFQVMFVLQNAPTGSAKLSNIEISPFEAENRTAKFDLTLMMDEGEAKLSGMWEYNTDLFDRTTIQRMNQHFERLLAAIVANPHQPVAHLPLLTAAERQQLLVEWNQTEVAYPDDKCFHQWFEEQAEQTPNALALLFGEQQLTYRELNSLANRLATHLQTLGVGPDQLVGLCVERSLEMVVGLLGILKAGGAYVPLDPAYPQERLAFMLSDCGANVLLTQERLLDQVNQLRKDALSDDAHIILLDQEWEALSAGMTSQSAAQNAMSGVTPDNLAYIIYTSGSTGKPKGVQVSHQNLVHSTHARISYYDEQPTSFLLLSSFAFDSSVAGIFWTLCQGGRLVLPPQDFQEEPQAIANLIAQHQASYLLGIPSFYALILTQTDLAKLASLRAVIVGGEACPTELVKKHYERQPNTTLFNEYGPTEASVWCTVYKCRFPEERSQVPIGRPIPNSKLYILDAHLQPVPIGVPGQLYIGGAGVTRGYLNRPKLTQERFIPNPFGEGKLYKSGDIARYIRSCGKERGNIDFLGRIDHQVKLRGYRIELGEIEAVLNEHAQVRETVAIVREDQPGDQRLVAYFVAKGQPAPTSSDLRRYLNQKLPDYMVPSLLVELDAMPLTPSRKIDRRALPAPDLSRSNLDEPFVAPRTPTEETIASIFASVLQIEQVGIHDNFFELGGHSLLATQVNSRMRKTFQLDFPLRDLFEEPTVAQLAEQVETLRWASQKGVETDEDREEGEL